MVAMLCATQHGSETPHSSQRTLSITHDILDVVNIRNQQFKMPPLRKRFSSSVNGVLKPVLSPFMHCSSVPLTLLPWKISYNAVNSLLNASDDAERSKLVNVWKESKLQELGVVVICVRSFSSGFTDSYEFELF